LKIKILNSLKNRYILFASLLSVLIIIVSFFGYRNVSLTTQDTTKNIETRRQLLDHIGQIRIRVFDAYKSLDAFLLDPTRQDVKKEVHTALQSATALSQTLTGYQWTVNHNLDDTILNLIASLKSLDDEVDELMEIRVDPTRQYPSLALGNDLMQPNRNNLNNAIALVLDDPTVKTG